MNEASEALADVRGWLCDNLSAGDAGKICGMLSVVSRHIVELEEENAKLQRERDYLLHNESPTACKVRRVRSAMKDVNDENAKLRNLLQQNYEFMVHLNETEAYPSGGDLDMQMWLLLNEAGIEVDE